MTVGRALCKIGVHRWRPVRHHGVKPHMTCTRCEKVQAWSARDKLNLIAKW